MRFSDYIDPCINFFVKGKLRPENKIQLTENGKYIYAHFDFCLKWRKSVLAVNIVALLIGGIDVLLN
jgi:Cu(I)/Ag(I) efflux system membrane protein CusA/SilA